MLGTAITTLMVRNMPSNYTQRDLMQDFTDLGLAGTFDFLYMPLDKSTMSNVGYGFVNFLQPSLAEECVRVLQQYRFCRNRLDKGRLAEVSPAYIQGLEANLRHYEKAIITSAKQKQRRPLIMARVSNSLGCADGDKGDDPMSYMQPFTLDSDVGQSPSGGENGEDIAFELQATAHAKNF